MKKIKALWWTTFGVINVYGIFLLTIYIIFMKKKRWPIKFILYPIFLSICLARCRPSQQLGFWPASQWSFWLDARMGDWRENHRWNRALRLLFGRLFYEYRLVTKWPHLHPFQHWRFHQSGWKLDEEAGVAFYNSFIAALEKAGYSKTEKTEAENNNAFVYENADGIGISIAREMNWSGTVELDSYQIVIRVNNEADLRKPMLIIDKYWLWYVLPLSLAGRGTFFICKRIF